MLDLISVMADETIFDEDGRVVRLAKGLISKPFSHRYRPLALAVARLQSCSPATRPGASPPTSPFDLRSKPAVRLVIDSVRPPNGGWVNQCR